MQGKGKVEIGGEELLNTPIDYQQGISGMNVPLEMKNNIRINVVSDNQTS